MQLGYSITSYFGPGVADGLAALRDLGADEVVVRPMDDANAEETLRVVAEARALL